MQIGRRLYFHGQYAACKQRKDLPSPLCQVAIYAWCGRVFAKLSYFAKSFAKLLEEYFRARLVPKPKIFGC